jgi:hypothetical protein
MSKVGTRSWLLLQLTAAAGAHAPPFKNGRPRSSSRRPLRDSSIPKRQNKSTENGQNIENSLFTEAIDVQNPHLLDDCALPRFTGTLRGEKHTHTHGELKEIDKFKSAWKDGVQGPIREGAKKVGLSGW